MSQEPTTHLQLELREDLSQHQRNIVYDTIPEDFYEFHEDSNGELFIKIDGQADAPGAPDQEADLVHVVFGLGVAYERLEQRYGIEKPFTFTRVAIEHEESE